MKRITQLLLLFLIVCVIILIILRIRSRRHIEYFTSNFLTPKLQGGLGNQLFELATAYSLSKAHGKQLQLTESLINNSIHSSVNYMDTIFKNFSSYLTSVQPEKQINNRMSASQYTTLINDISPLELKGYNHNWREIHPYRAEFISMLDFNTSIETKYPKLSESAFIHIRGGDFKSFDYLNVKLKDYYNNAIVLLKSHNVKHLYVFTNDKTYTESFDLFNNIDHTYVDENEYDSLYLMSRCGAGGIASNSTFSWWGLYLNLDRPHLIIPQNWILEEHRPDDYYPDFHFPEATVINNI